MKPVTDRYKVSRAKPAYLIDATAAPICIIAPISSRGAADMILSPRGQQPFHLGHRRHAGNRTL